MGGFSSEMGVAGGGPYGFRGCGRGWGWIGDGGRSCISGGDSIRWPVSGIKVTAVSLIMLCHEYFVVENLLYVTESGRGCNI